MRGSGPLTLLRSEIWWRTIHVLPAKWPEVFDQAKRTHPSSNIKHVPSLSVLVLQHTENTWRLFLINTRGTLEDDDKDGVSVQNANSRISVITLQPSTDVLECVIHSKYMGPLKYEGQLSLLVQNLNEESHGSIATPGGAGHLLCSVCNPQCPL